MARVLFALLMAFTAFLGTVAADSIELYEKPAIADSTNRITGWDNDEDNTKDEDEWKNDNKFFSNLFLDTKVALEVQWGSCLPSIAKNAFNSSFSSIGSAEARLEFMKRKDDVFNEPNLIKIESIYLFLGNQSPEMISSAAKEKSKAEIDIWRFGLGFKGGYGYKLGSSVDLLLYNSAALCWAVPSVNSEDKTLPLRDIITLNKYEGALKFGDFSDMGIQFNLFGTLAVSFSYERQSVLPKCVFLNWLASSTIEVLPAVLIDIFTKKVLKDVPFVAPIANFALKSALNYGWYQLRKQKMYWPLNSTEPLTIDSFKFGVSFLF